MPALPPELRSVNMIGLYHKYNTTADPFAKYFNRQAASNTATVVAYDVLQYRRGLAKAVPYGGRAPTVTMPVRSRVSYEPPTYKEQIPFDVEIMSQILDVGKLTANQRAEIARGVLQIRLDFERRAAWLHAQWMTGGALLAANGTVPGIADGNIYLDYASSALDTPIGPLNTGMLASHIIAGVVNSWALPTTDILADLDACAVLIEEDGDVPTDDLVVIHNRNTHRYLLTNNAVTDAEEAKRQLFKNGDLREIWGYNFDVIGNRWQSDSETMVTDTGEYLIPDNIVIVTTKDNVAAGRKMIECHPSDTRAPDGARGFYAWTDIEEEHPHAPTSGAEITHGPAILNPDAMVILKNVTQEL